MVQWRRCGLLMLVLMLAAVNAEIEEDDMMFKPVLDVETLLIESVEFGDGGMDAIELAPVRVHLYGQTVDSSATGGLKLMHCSKSKGRDERGHFTETRQSWSADHWPNVEGSHFVTSAKMYSDAVVFRQEYPLGAKGCEAVLTRDHVRSAWPNLSLLTKKEMGFFSWNGVFMLQHQHGIINPQGDNLKKGFDAGPLLILPNESSGHVIFSHYGDVLALNVAVDEKLHEYHVGPFGSLCNIPEGYAAESIMVFGKTDVIKTARRWGDLLSAPFPAPKNEDFTVNNLGYSTDRGGYYYYNIDNSTKNYQETMLLIKNDADELKIPYRYWLLDSWWYHQEPKKEGVTDWTAMKKVFPDGMEKLFRDTGMYVMAHNRYWSPKNVYKETYDFIVEDTTALPTSRKFWDDLFRTSVGWGLRVYEQDWLNKQTHWLNAAFTDVATELHWLQQMGDAAASAGLSIQYCMPLPRHLIHSVQQPAVTQARVSNDYVDEEQWQIGSNALIHWALNLRPSKDSSWSQREQPGNSWKRNELYPDLQLTIMALSTGPVAFSDKVGHSSRWRIMRTCREDGVLLQPAFPPLPLSSWFRQSVFGNGGIDGEVYQTQMHLKGTPPYFVIVAADVKNAATLRPGDLYHFDHHHEHVVYTYDIINGEVANLKVDLFDPLHGIEVPKCGRADFRVWYIAPVLKDGWVLLGELEKVVPISPKRVSHLTVELLDDESEVYLTVMGAPKERVAMYLARVGNIFSGTTLHVQTDSSGRAHASTATHLRHIDSAQTATGATIVKTI